MNNFIRAASLFLLAIGSSAAMAVPIITGNIAFFGTSTVTGTTVNFTGNSAMVAYADGDFAAEGVVGGFPGSMATFSSLDYSTPFSSVSSLWAVGGFSFDLQTIEIGPTGPGVSLALSGTGTLTHAGYYDTAYSWAYSGNAIGGTLQVFSAASSSIPEPGSLALLGLGLIGFAVRGYGRRRA